MNNIKIIFIDIDGTLLNDKKQITKENIDSITNAQNKGIKIVLCSGRSAPETKMYSDICNIKDYIICSTGGCVYDIKNDNIIYSSNINKNSLKNLYDIAIKNNMRIVLHSESRKYVNTIKYTDEKEKLVNNIDDFLNTNSVSQVVLISSDIKTMIKIKPLIEKDKNLEIINQSNALYDNNLNYSKPTYYDIVNPSTNKSLGIKELCKYLNIDLNDTMFIGDNYNDLSAFSIVGVSVAMENAKDDIKNFAQITTYSNNKDGVSFILEKVINIKNNQN